VPQLFQNTTHKKKHVINSGRTAKGISNDRARRV